MNGRPSQRRKVGLTAAMAIVVFLGLVSLATTFTVQSWNRGADEELLDGLEENREQVVSVLAAEGIDAIQDRFSPLMIDSGDVHYAFTDRGIKWIEVGALRIDISSQSDDGHVRSFVVMLGNGFDALKIEYGMRDLSKPRVYYLGDDIEWVQSSIEKEISTNEMKELVAQAEHYQDVIRAELDKLGSKK